MMNDNRDGRGEATIEDIRAAAEWQSRLGRQDASLHVHLMGIGGAGLSAIARVLLESGLTVSGSDRQAGPLTAALEEAGARIFVGQTAANLGGETGVLPDVVLISSAIDAGNPERMQAEALGIPVVKRSEFLPALLAEKQLIAVAGTHGKSTTTAMIVTVLRQNGIEAGYIIGAQLPGFGNAAAGDSDYFVIEADEYDHMFLGLRPAAAVVTNVEWDHPDCFPTPADFRQAFADFIAGVDPEGLIVSCADDDGAAQLRAGYAGPVKTWLTYGVDAKADLQAERFCTSEAGGASADLSWWHAPACSMTLAVPGLHNMQNAMAALCVANWCDIPMAQAAEALAGFRGTARRFEQKGTAAGVTVIDDYAHHPTEIAATLAAARSRYPQHRIRAVFQPHTFSRTRRMLYRMGESFDMADQVFVTAIYAARETDDGSVSAAELVDASDHPDISHVPELAALASALAATSRPGDVVITLGAGDGYKVGEMLLQLLAEADGQ